MKSQGRAVIGQPAPSFEAHAVVDGRIKDVSSNTYTEANHWLVLIFFPKAWSFICPTEIRSFSARLEEFLYSRSCAILFCSTDSEYCLRAWNSTSELEGGLSGAHVPLISDSSHKICKDYGVLIEEEGIAQRALFIIDPKGILRAMTVNDADVGRSVDEVQRVLDALIFKDEFGEGCPVDWKRGDKGIDISSKARIEGAIEVEARKSWTDWARPKLTRAWSGASQRSVAPSIAFSHAPLSRMASQDNSLLQSLTSAHADQQRLSTAAPVSSTTSSNGFLDAQTKIDLQKNESERAALNNERYVGTAF